VLAAERALVQDQRCLLDTPARFGAGLCTSSDSDSSAEHETTPQGAFGGTRGTRDATKIYGSLPIESVPGGPGSDLTSHARHRSPFAVCRVESFSS
jgi:hypothetical protein